MFFFLLSFLSVLMVYFTLEILCMPIAHKTTKILFLSTKINKNIGIIKNQFIYLKIKFNIMIKKKS